MIPEPLLEVNNASGGIWTCFNPSSLQEKGRLDALPSDNRQDRAQGVISPGRTVWVLDIKGKCHWPRGRLFLQHPHTLPSSAMVWRASIDPKLCVPRISSGMSLAGLSSDGTSNEARS